jgi:hypothetical protein
MLAVPFLWSFGELGTKLAIEKGDSYPQTAPSHVLVMVDAFW